MKFITANSGQLVQVGPWQNKPADLVRTGIAGLDELFGHGGLVRGAVHELLYPPRASRPMFPAMLLGRAAASSRSEAEPALLAGPVGWKAAAGAFDPTGVIVISDPQKQLYPPAAAQLGIPLWKLYLLHPANRQQELWAIGECLASAGVAAVIANVASLTQVEARRLQLAAERGGSLALLMRPASKNADIYAAATRIMVAPAPPTATSQRWSLQLLHGHGEVGQRIMLEYNREEHTVHTSAQLAGDPTAASTKTRKRASA